MAETAEDKHWLDPPAWWRKVRPLRWILAIGVAIFVADRFSLLERVMPTRALGTFLRSEPHPEAEFYTRVEPVRVPLADRFTSYDGVETVTKALTDAGYEKWSARSRHTPDSPAYPPYDFDMLVVSGYRHLGEEGELTLSFFNDRLFEAQFIPASPETYQRQLRALGLKPRYKENARAEKLEGDLRVVSTVDLALSPVGRSLNTQAFVIWQDMRLIQARAAWDAKYGGIPIETESGG